MSREEEQALTSETGDAFAARVQRIRAYFMRDTLNGIPVRRVDIHEWPSAREPHLLVTMWAWNTDPNDDQVYEEKRPVGFDPQQPPRAAIIQDESKVQDAGNQNKGQ